ncbi:uncharacterized protein DMAD_01004 [Drosophila madeirensis]|uniref:MEI-217 n=1 Tax=Drosophila madeirensis TaxID=30013 RepID=A0AAU9FYC7_DROMD
MFNVNTNFPEPEGNENHSNVDGGDDILRQRFSQFQEQKLVEKFCRESHLLKILEGTVAAFVEDYKRTRTPEKLLTPLLLRLDFVYGDLLTHAPSLLPLVVEEPLQFGQAVKYSVYGLVRHQLKVAGLKPIDIGQLHAQWRVVGLPFSSSLLYDPAAHSLRLGLSLVQGILSAYTPAETLVLQSTWYCGSGCLRNALQTSATDAPLCPNCSRPMCEYQKLRVTETYRLLAILPSCTVQTPRSANRLHRPTIVRLRAYAYTCDLKLGAKYLITGHFDGSANYDFEACHLKSE